MSVKFKDMARLGHSPQVHQVMTPDPVTVQRDVHLSDVMELMERRHIQHIPVMDGTRLVGLLSERNLRDALPSVLTLQDPVARRRALAATRADQVWVEHPVTVRPSATVLEAIRVMRRLKAGSVPVVDHDRLVGILTSGDLISLLEHLVDDGA